MSSRASRKLECLARWQVRNVKVAVYLPSVVVGEECAVD